MMKFKLLEKKPETSDCISFILQPDQALDWKPGQYMQYTLPQQNMDDRGEKRYFTISSAPFENHAMITTRFTPEKGSSFKKTLKDLEVGTQIEAEGPFGRFTVDDPNQNLVFMAGGIGVTPFRSILLDLDHNQKPVNITLLYSNRNDEIVFKSEFDLLAQKHPNLKIQYIMDPQRIDTNVIQTAIPNLLSCVFYLSGPKPFVDAMKTNLEQLAVKPEQIKTDYFPGYEQ